MRGHGPCYGAAWRLVIFMLTVLQRAEGEISSVGFKNRYYQALGYQGTRVLEFNQTRRFTDYVEVTWPQAFMVDSQQRVWIADARWHQVVLLEAGTRYIKYPAFYQVYAGVRGAGGHFDGYRQKALFNQPSGVVVSEVPGQSLMIYVADKSNHIIRHITYDTGRVATTAGWPKKFGLVDGPGNEARFQSPSSVAIDATGQHLFVLDNGRRIRHVNLAISIPHVKTLVDGGCREVRRTTAYSSIIIRIVGCHPDWTAAVADDNTVTQYQYGRLYCPGHVATCGPRDFPVLGDLGSKQLMYSNAVPVLVALKQAAAEAPNPEALASTSQLSYSL